MSLGPLPLLLVLAVVVGLLVAPGWASWWSRRRGHPPADRAGDDPSG